MFKSIRDVETDVETTGRNKTQVDVGDGTGYNSRPSVYLSVANNSVWPTHEQAREIIMGLYKGLMKADKAMGDEFLEELRGAHPDDSLE